jgi:shikimate dehydrogenase
VVDLVYGRDTPLLSAARASGCATQDGLEMLVQQGAESFWLWTGRRPNADRMREACWERMEIVAC